MAKASQIHQDSTLKHHVACDPRKNSPVMEATISFSDDSIGENSDNSVSSSLSDLEEDASSSSSSKTSSSSSFSGPLFELSSLMTQLPIKQGLSKYYHGKSQSFTSLANVGNLDIAKKESSYSQRMKSCRSYGWGLNSRKFGPKATITKKFSASKGSLLSSKGGSCRSSLSKDIKTYAEVE